MSVPSALLERALEVLGNRPAALVTDLDGTISPIVARPSLARVLPEARRGLIDLQQRLALVAVVTGRSIADAMRLLEDAPLVYIGNHGLETEVAGQHCFLPAVGPWIALLQTIRESLSPLTTLPGVLIEDKGASLSVHYRLALDPGRARAAIQARLAASVAEQDVRIEHGRQVVNVLPRVPINKGTSVEDLVGAYRLQGIVYIGDDVTDLTVFEALARLRTAGGCRTLSIGVESGEGPAGLRARCDATLPSPEVVAELLTDLTCRLPVRAKP